MLHKEQQPYNCSITLQHVTKVYEILYICPLSVDSYLMFFPKDKLDTIYNWPRLNQVFFDEYVRILAKCPFYSN